MHQEAEALGGPLGYILPTLLSRSGIVEPGAMWPAAPDAFTWTSYEVLADRSVEKLGWSGMSAELRQGRGHKNGGGWRTWGWMGSGRGESEHEECCWRPALREGPQFRSG